MMRRFLLILAGMLVLAAVLSACGKKTAPIPPQAIIPLPITDLTHQLDDSGVTLSWSAPVRSEQGRRLPEIDSYLIERAEYALADFCKNCPVRYTEVGVIAGEDDPAGWGENLTFRDEELKAGHIYYYRVKSKVGWRVISRPSEPVRFEWRPPAGKTRNEAK
ncbi:MAG: fibronectin type III domain-containing protein [Desulfurivibrionaceae bacterium]